MKIDRMVSTANIEHIDMLKTAVVLVNSATDNHQEWAEVVHGNTSNPNKVAYSIGYAFTSSVRRDLSALIGPIQDAVVYLEGREPHPDTIG